VITVPGYPPRVEGRQALAERSRPYRNAIQLDRCFDLAVYHDADKGVVLLEYAVEGHTVAENHPYANRFVSVITICDREIVHWRDHLNPVAVFNALGWPRT
jgi:ketosteroid isomerase-like protein